MSLWLLYGGVGLMFVALGQKEFAGSFGDWFGGFGALLSGISSCGVVYALILQGRELNEQVEAREEEAAYRDGIRKRDIFFEETRLIGYMLSFEWHCLNRKEASANSLRRLIFDLDLTSLKVKSGDSLRRASEYYPQSLNLAGALCGLCTVDLDLSFDTQVVGIKNILSSQLSDLDEEIGQLHSSCVKQSEILHDRISARCVAE